MVVVFVSMFLVFLSEAENGNGISQKMLNRHSWDKKNSEIKHDIFLLSFMGLTCFPHIIFFWFIWILSSYNCPDL